MDEETIIYDILGGLPECYSTVGQLIEEAIEDADVTMTLAKVEGLLKKRWQWLKKKHPDSDKARQKPKSMQDDRKSGNSMRGGSKFKQQEKTETERGGKKEKAAKVTATGKRTCHCCGSEDHLISNCTDKKKLAKLNKIRLADKKCYVCGKLGHIAAACSAMDEVSDVGEEEEESTGKKKEKKGKAKKAKVVDVDSDGNTADSGSDDEYLLSESGMARSKVNSVRVRAATDSDITAGTGVLVELVLDTGASSPIGANEKELINYRKAKKGSRHVVEVADGVEYLVRGYGTWCGFVRTSKKKKVWVEIHNVLYVPEMSERLLSVKGIREAGGKVTLEKRRGKIILETG
jgi:hypothetical protein